MLCRTWEVAFSFLRSWKELYKGFSPPGRVVPPVSYDTKVAPSRLRTCQELSPTKGDKWWPKPTIQRTSGWTERKDVLLRPDQFCFCARPQLLAARELTTAESMGWGGTWAQRCADRDLDVDTSVLSAPCWRYIFYWIVPFSVVSRNIFIDVHIYCYIGI